MIVLEQNSLTALIDSQICTDDNFITIHYKYSSIELLQVITKLVNANLSKAWLLAMFTLKIYYQSEKDGCVFLQFFLRTRSHQRSFQCLGHARRAETKTRGIHPGFHDIRGRRQIFRATFSSSFGVDEFHSGGISAAFHGM